MLNGLDYLHTMFIVHRDLKPSNILVSADRRIGKIADFGVSTTLDSQGDQLQGFRGTPYYMAPEVRVCFVLSRRRRVIQEHPSATARLTCQLFFRAGLWSGR